MELPAALGLVAVAMFVVALLLYRELQRTRGLLEAAGRVHEAAMEKARKAPAPSLTAEALIHDLTSGAALVRIERLNPADVFLRSPRL